tara:strand:+ start:1387 stop:2634 length:1248 start_codon:yes stop_codon:yes gene_type:complete
LDTIFKTHLGLNYEIHDHDKEISPYAPKIIYSDKKTNTTGISIYKHPLLSERVIYAQGINVRNDQKLPCFFQNYSFKGDYPFDLFSMVFYLLTRYEEYLRFPSDRHGRFSAKQSLAFRNDFLDCPIVDFWILDLKRKIEEKWNLKISLPRSFRIEPTIDIDTPYAYKHRSILAHIGGTGRDIFLLRGERLKKRISTLLGQQEDVFDSYEYIFSCLHQNGLTAIFFFLMKCQLPDDQNFSVNSKAFEKLVQIITDKFEIGIHPSLSSQKSVLLWQKEKRKLESYSSTRVSSSRQHFLHLAIPKTYRHLLSEKVTDDFSMAYHDHSGFRASTSVPFYWYDLKKEEPTNLMIHPAQIMDATLRHHMSLDISSALIEVQKMKKTIEEVEGVFSFIWHNSSFAEIYGWKNWKKVFEQCLQ